MRSVVLATAFPSSAMEYVRAVADLDELRMLGVAQALPHGGDAEVFAERRHGLALRVTGTDRVRERVGRLVVEAQLPVLGAPCCDSENGNGGIVVRDPDTEVVLAATRTIADTIAIECGS